MCGARARRPTAELEIELVGGWNVKIKNILGFFLGRFLHRFSKIKNAKQLTANKSLEAKSSRRSNATRASARPRGNSASNAKRENKRAALTFCKSYQKVTGYQQFRPG